MSNNLNLPQVTANQNQKEVTINDQAAALDAALTENLAVDMSAGNVTLSSTQFRSAIAFVCSGQTASRDLTIAAVERGLFVVINASATYPVVVKKGSTSVTVPASGTAIFATDGTTNSLTKIGEAQAAGTILYLTGFNILGLPGDNARVAMHIFTETVVFPSGLTGSQAKSKAASTGNVSFDIQKNGSSIGSVVFNVSSTATFTFSSQQTFNAGDILELIAPTPQDGTLADVAITLKGAR